MSGSIRLHPELGVNPRLTFCPRCGGEGKDLVLAGARNFKDICRNCGCVGYGGFDHRTCPRCKGGSFDRKELEPQEKLPSSVPCDTCQKEIDEHRAVVEQGGGIYFKCEKCGITGVIKGRSEMAKATRAHMQKIASPPVADGWWTTPSQHEGNGQNYLPIAIALDDCRQHTVVGPNDPTPSSGNHTPVDRSAKTERHDKS